MVSAVSFCPLYDVHRLVMGRKQVTQRKGKTDKPLAQRQLWEDLIRQQGDGINHVEGAAAASESALLVEKGLLVVLPPQKV